MNERRPDERLEAQLRRAADRLPYPPTPDLATAVRARLAADAPRRATRSRTVLRLGLALVVLALALLAVPQVRAAIGAVLRIGAVRISLPAPAPTSTLRTTVPARPTARIAPTPTIDATRFGPLAPLGQLDGETSLAQARSTLSFPVRLPTYPPAVGQPDRVYVQNLGPAPHGQTTILVWLVSGSRDAVRMSLWEIDEDVFAEKSADMQIRIAETQVQGRPALWIQGPHMLRFRFPGGEDHFELARLVDGQVLIWTQGTITYRLETTLPLGEAVKVAESLR